MTEDARFEDGAARPLALVAHDGDDLQVIAALVQDAVFPIAQMTWDRHRRRFALLLNRFRWEEVTASPPERVQSVLVFSDVMAVSSQGIDRVAQDLVLSVLTLEFAAGADGTGRITVTLAGGGAIALEVEALDVTLRDVTRPYLAPSGKAPRHPG